MKKPALISVVLFFVSVISDLQSADGKPKFLGNILDTSQIDEKFATYWDQVTAENCGKWGQTEPTRGFMDWSKLDSERPALVWLKDYVKRTRPE